MREFLQQGCYRTLGDRKVIAKIDTFASENFVNSAILNENELSTLQSGPPHAIRAAVGATLRFLGTICLTPVLQRRAYPDTFQVSSEIRAELILGQPWLRNHQVIHDHVADCIFVGATGLQRVYLSPLPRDYEVTQSNTEFEIKHDFTPAFKERFLDLIRDHPSSFHNEGRLRQTLAAV